jgi:valyl-tRNA synthetase
MRKKLDSLSGAYDPQTFEQAWAEEWAAGDFYTADPAAGGEAYSIVIPPPNVTGVLHMGHALNNTLQDILARYHRMDGKNVLWVPGTDHAGIATQNVVERQLAAQGIKKEALGRDAFLERVWVWKAESGGQIIRQLKRLGASCDWSRERFTMDEGLSAAVRKVFVTLYEQGLIYRGTRLINWCPRCLTALSDIEVEHQEEPGKLYHLRYPLVSGEGAISVATTRPETLLGDVAVAVHPEDERYAKLVGRQVVLPLTGRTIPVIADTYVDREFGSGVVKITPAHDFNDYEVGERHGLAKLNIFDAHAKLKLAGNPAVTDAATAGAYDGLDRHEARKQIVDALAKLGLIERIDEHLHAVGHCYRCKTVVEPYLSPQWFVRVGPPDQEGSLAHRAIQAVANGDTRIIPEQWKNSYFAWMENIKDWCVSRQLWWGHRIPAYACADCGRAAGSTDEKSGDPQRKLVSALPLAQCPYCGGTHLTPDPDVLDTWFSSALWPFTTMGWPADAAELKRYYPTSALVTGFDILFFWVARMLMMGLHFMGEVPFKDVYIHALVRDAEGQKMSKSKGNVIDPLEMIGTFGADPLRFTLASMAAQGRDIKLSAERVETNKAFANKIWNATKFALMHLKDYDPNAAAELSTADRWILSRLDLAAAEVREALADYRFNDAALRVYGFVWHELCDWYLELTKPVLFGADERAKAGARQTLCAVFAETYALLHPFMPFVTEELWHHLPGNEAAGHLGRARYPRPQAGRRDAAAEADMDAVIEVIRAVRNIKGENNVAPSVKVGVRLHITSPAFRAAVERNRNLLVDLAKIEALDLEAPAGVPDAAKAMLAGAELFVPLAGLINVEEEIKRLEKELAKLTQEGEKLRTKLANPEFTGKAPEAVVKKETARLAEVDEKLAKTRAGLDSLRK